VPIGDELAATGSGGAGTTGGGGATGSAGEVTGAALIRRCSVTGVTCLGVSFLIGTSLTGLTGLTGLTSLTGLTGFGAAGSARFAAAGGLIRCANTTRASSGGGIIW